MEQKQNKIICPICGRKGKRSTHHLKPQRFWHGEGQTVELCEACHRELERLIRDAEILPAWQYENIYYEFLAVKLKERDDDGY